MYIHAVQELTMSYPTGFGMTNNIITIKLRFEDLMRIARHKLVDQEAINLICMGASGAIVAAVLYPLMQDQFPRITIRIVHIKKRNEDSHSARVPYILPGATIFVDDFSNTGATIENAVDAIREEDGVPSFKFDYIVLMAYYGPLALKKIKAIKAGKHLVGYSWS